MEPKEALAIIGWFRGDWIMWLGRCFGQVTNILSFSFPGSRCLTVWLAPLLNNVFLLYLFE